MGFETLSAMKAREVELQQTVFLPDEIQVGSFLGRGRRSFSYKGKYENQDVVIKVYRREFVEKYQQKCSVDIAEFEFERNTNLYRIDDIRQYISRPYKVFKYDSGYTHSFVQEYVEGITLKQLINQSGFLPKEVLDAGYKIVKIAEANGVHDIDISQGNIKVTRRKGVWIPKLYDFNLLPQHISPPNLLIALGIKLGLRRKSWRDYRSLKCWKKAGMQQRSLNMQQNSE
ncbi:MAG: hypothetical protein OXC42_02215 [Gammaproteobacteria bacterium]|nr:hypothetical protein [Gammaproteobacteria bacterium]